MWPTCVLLDVLTLLTIRTLLWTRVQASFKKLLKHWLHASVDFRSWSSSKVYALFCVHLVVNYVRVGDRRQLVHIVGHISIIYLIRVDPNSSDFVGIHFSCTLVKNVGYTFFLLVSQPWFIYAWNFIYLPIWCKEVTQNSFVISSSPFSHCLTTMM